MALGPSTSCPAWYASTAELPRTGDTLTIVVVVPVGEMCRCVLVAIYYPSGSGTRGAVCREYGRGIQEGGRSIWGAHCARAHMSPQLLKEYSQYLLLRGIVQGGPGFSSISEKIIRISIRTRLVEFRVCCGMHRIEYSYRNAPGAAKGQLRIFRFDPTTQSRSPSCRRR